MYFIFWTFLSLAGRSNWLILVDILDFVRLFDFSTSCRELKMIYLYRIFWFFPIFRLFDLWVGGQNYQFNSIYWFLSTFWPLAERLNLSILLDILNFSTSRPLTGRSKLLILLNILYFFDFSTFRPFGGSSNWLFLQNIFFFYFSTFRAVAARSNWLILMNILNFIEFSTFRPVGGRPK